MYGYASGPSAKFFVVESGDMMEPGLGFWLIPFASWLFAFSTIIAWNYYGEQSIVFLFGENAVRPYRIIYCLLTMASVLMMCAVKF